MMHSIYTRLIQLLEKDPSNVDEFDEWLDDAMELGSEEECAALSEAISNAKKEVLAISLAKHLLMGDQEEDEDYEQEKRMTRTQLAMAAQTKNKIQMTKTQMEIMRRLIEQENNSKVWHRDEPNLNRF